MSIAGQPIKKQVPASSSPYSYSNRSMKNCKETKQQTTNQAASTTAHGARTHNASSKHKAQQRWFSLKICLK
jgi:hypothetical protein